MKRALAAAAGVCVIGGSQAFLQFGPQSTGQQLESSTRRSLGAASYLAESQFAGNDDVSQTGSTSVQSLLVGVALGLVVGISGMQTSPAYAADAAAPSAKVAPVAKPAPVAAPAAPKKNPLLYDRRNGDDETMRKAYQKALNVGLNPAEGQGQFAPKYANNKTTGVNYNVKKPRDMKAMNQKIVNKFSAFQNQHSKKRPYEPRDSAWFQN